MSIDATLKTLVGILSVVLLVVLGYDSFQSWRQLTSADRVASVADASANMFIALSNIRIDSSNSQSALANDTILPGFQPAVVAAREKELIALEAATTTLRTIDFADRDQTVAYFDQALARLKTLQFESANAITKPKFDRPSTLQKDYVDHLDKLATQIAKTSGEIQALIELDDSMIDHLIGLYKIAWTTRVSAGAALVNISDNITVVRSMPEDAVSQQAAAFGRVGALWDTLEAQAKGLNLPPRFAEAIAEAKRNYFGADFRQIQVDTLKKLIAGQPPGYDRGQWNDVVLPRLASLAAVASTILDSARDSAAETRHAAQWRLMLQLALLGLSLAFTITANWIISQRVVRSLTSMTRSMTQIAAGDLETPIPGMRRSDEVGGMAAAVAVFRDGLKRNAELEAEANRSRLVAESRRKELLAELASQFQSAVGGIVGSVANSARDLKAAATAMTQTAQETSQRSTSVAAAAEEASANVTSVASSAEELGASVQEISRQVRQSTEMSDAAVVEARSTAIIVGELSQAADRISEVLGLISTIAGQTNLLALNATIEAARAGESGRGFAVVAAEVKELANQTAKATADISAQISSIQNSTERAVGAIGGIAETIQAMNRVAGTISEAMNAQGIATAEIVRNITQASQGTGEVTDNITTVAHAAQASGSAATQVLAASGQLSDQASRLSAEVDRFLGTVRAA